MPNLGFYLKIILKFLLVAGGALWNFAIFPVPFTSVVWPWQGALGQNLDQKFSLYRDYICPLTCTMGSLRVSVSDNKRYPACLCYNERGEVGMAKEGDGGNFYKTKCEGKTTINNYGPMMQNTGPNGDLQAYQNYNGESQCIRNTNSKPERENPRWNRTLDSKQYPPNFPPALLGSLNCLSTCEDLGYKYFYTCNGEGRSSGGRKFGPVEYCACGDRDLKPGPTK